MPWYGWNLKYGLENILRRVDNASRLNFRERYRETMMDRRLRVVTKAGEAMYDDGGDIVTGRCQDRDVGGVCEDGVSRFFCR
jgi:hypothetical protein